MFERVSPGPGQESVWDYPRPPRVEPLHARVTIELGGRMIADSTAAVRVLANRAREVVGGIVDAAPAEVERLPEARQVGHERVQ